MQDVMADMGLPDARAPRVHLADGWRWCPIGPGESSRLASVLASWVGTPHAAAQRFKGRGVDCTNLVAGVYDELLRRDTPSPLPRLRQSSGLHRDDGSLPMVNALRDLTGTRLIHDRTIEPGDLIAAVSENAPGAARREGHVLIAGVRPWTLLHATSASGTCWTSWGVIRDRSISVFRFPGKGVWA